MHASRLLTRSGQIDSAKPRRDLLSNKFDLNRSPMPTWLLPYILRPRHSDPPSTSFVRIDIAMSCRDRSDTSIDRDLYEQIALQISMQKLMRANRPLILSVRIVFARSYRGF